ncbi:hypothetical protein XELAEV_18008018mg [Xenopus laevis]|uniref:Uncharacterized protein n=1 Tax=Xenopus laevis TaxID=8355 RepID=A0A974I5X4_XENLA|nr:hypothetical protein XELAEV_18008018mg [Xenopus laevis]
MLIVSRSVPKPKSKKGIFYLLLLVQSCNCNHDIAISGIDSMFCLHKSSVCCLVKHSLNYKLYIASRRENSGFFAALKSVKENVIFPSLQNAIV